MSMALSITAAATWAPAPSTTRGHATPLSADASGQRLAYASHKSIFLRSIDHPEQSTQYTAHTAATTVARFAPSGYYVASGDASGTVRVWDCVGEGGTKGDYAILSGPIHDLAWDAESKRIIAVGEGKARLGHCFTADSGNTVGEITGHSMRINSVAIRPHRPWRAATAADDSNLVFLHGAPFKYHASTNQHRGFVHSVAFSPDGAHLASVGADQHIWLYDGQTGQVKTELGIGQHTGSLFGVSWSHDSRQFVTASADQTVKVWDVETQALVQSWKLTAGDSDAVPSIAHQQVGVVWPHGRSDRLIISLSLNGELNYFAVGSPQTTRQVRGHQGNITALAASAPSTRQGTPTLWTSSFDGRVCSWDLESGAAESVDGQGHQAYISGMSSSSSASSSNSRGEHVYSVGWDDTLRCIDASKRAFTQLSSKLQGQPCAVAVCINDSTRVVVATNKSLELYDDTITKIADLSTPFTPTAIAAAARSDDVLIVVGADDGTLRFYSTSKSSNTTVSLQLDKEAKSSTTPITSLAVSPSAKFLAVGHASGKIILYHVADASVVADRWTAHTGRVSSMAWTRDEQYIVSGAWDATVMVWSVKHPHKMAMAKVLHAHKEGVNGVTWVEGNGINKDDDDDDDDDVGARVVSVGRDAAVKVWHVTGL